MSENESDIKLWFSKIKILWFLSHTFFNAEKICDGIFYV